MSSSGTRSGRAAGSWACGSGSVVARCARVSSARGAGAEFAHQSTRSPAALEALACRIFVRGGCRSNFGGGVGCPGWGHNPSPMARIARRAEIATRIYADSWDDAGASYGRLEQVWGAAAAPEVPRRGTRGAAAAPEVPPRHLGPAPEVPPRHPGPAPEVPPRHLRCRHHTERKLAGHVDSPSRAQIAPPRWLHTPVGVPWR